MSGSNIFVNEASLNRHYSQTHGLLKFHCDICGNRFRNNDQLKAHNKVGHLGSRSKAVTEVAEFSRKIEKLKKAAALAPHSSNAEKPSCSRDRLAAEAAAKYKVSF